MSAAKWIGKDGVHLKPELLVSLHGNYLNWTQANLSATMRTLAYYTTIMSSLLLLALASAKYASGQVAANYVVSKQITILGSTLVIVLATIGYLQCRRFYEKHLEAIAQVIKIEAALGFYGKIRGEPDPRLPFFDESAFIVECHKTALSCSNYEEFLERPWKVKGRIRLTFGSFILMALAMGYLF